MIGIAARTNVAAAGMLLVAACGACDEIDAVVFTRNDVRIVADKPDEVISAETVACDRPTRLKRHGSTFDGKIYIGCDAAPIITVKLSNGRSAQCQIGYVTRNMAQSWRFDLKDGVCQPIRQ